MKLNDLLDNPTPTVAELAKKYNTDPDHIHKQLTKGIKVELEHTSHEHVARRIALAHLGERLDYYTQLAKIDEKWSTKYKKSIDCGKPKGFSQRAHCAGRKARSSHKKTKSTSVSEATTRTSKVGAPGTLKAKISGPVTCDKVKKLKKRSNATPHDVRQANWFINMHGCSESTQLTELFNEPAKHMKWNRGQHGNYHFFETEFAFQNKRVVVGLYEDHDQTGARFVARNRDLDLPPTYKGYSVVFSVNGSTDVTGEIGAAASKLFAQVVSVLKGFLSTNAWDYVLFIGEEGSRDKLYDALAHLLARQVGAQVATYRSDFLIYKPFPLQEVLDTKLSRDDWEVVAQSPDGIEIEFKVGDDPYLLELIEYKRTPGIFEVIFSRTGMSMDDDATGILNTGNSFQVFAAVAQLLQYATEKMRIKALYFTAKEPSRIKLYKALTAYFATKLGWKFTTDPQFIPYKSKEAQFLVYKPGFSITEHVHLQEVFDVKLSRRDWEIVEQGKNYSIFKFYVEGTPYDLDFMQLRGRPGVYDVVFGQADSTDPISITGVGNASKVFAAVAQLVQKAIHHHHAQGISFTAVEPSRKKLYDALSKLFAQKMGWQLVTDPKLMPPHGQKEKPYLIIAPTMMKNSNEPTHDVSTSNTPHLIEVFDFKLDKKDWEITAQGDNYTHYKFVLDGTLYYLYFVELREKQGIYEVVLKHGTSATPISILGTGNAQKVFSSVAQLLRMAILQHHAQGISFTASEPSRKKLYDALSKLIAQTMGWKIITDPELMPYHQPKEKPYLIMDPTMQEAAGVGLVVPGNMPTGIHPDEIRRQAAKFGNKVTSRGVPPIADSSGKIPKIV